MTRNGTTLLPYKERLREGKRGGGLGLQASRSQDLGKEKAGDERGPGGEGWGRKDWVERPSPQEQIFLTKVGNP